MRHHSCGHSSRPNLAGLYADHCGLTALPENIGKLSKLRILVVSYNEIRELPLSIAALDVSCVLPADHNPLSIPPMSIVRHGISRSFGALSSLNDPKP